MTRTYWCLPLFVFMVQAVYTFSSMNQIRLEEVIETFRSPWWFQNRLVWNGSYSFLGWSSTLAFVYNVFGAGFYTPKLVKLFFELISFFALAFLLKKYLGRAAWLPFLAIGLSPTLMYFNSLSLSMGLEVSYFFICLFLLDKLGSQSGLSKILNQFMLGMVAMYAWLTYFGFLFYLPVLGVIYLYKLFTQSKKNRLIQILQNIGICFAGFILPLLILFFYIDNRELLVYDPVLGRGLFRSFGSIDLNPDVFSDNMKRISSDLFLKSRSYYFEQANVEFSGYYPVIGILAVIFASAVVVSKDKRIGKWVIFLWSFIFFYFLVISVIGPKTLGGLRRGTVILVLFYGLVGLVWNFRRLNGYWRLCVGWGLGLLIMHHLIVLPGNIAAISAQSFFRERWWFAGPSPERLYKRFINDAQTKGVTLTCVDENGASFLCPSLSLPYSAIAGTCYWNRLHCAPVTLYDPAQDRFFHLTIGYWGQGAHTEP